MLNGRRWSHDCRRPQLSATDRGKCVRSPMRTSTPCTAVLGRPARGACGPPHRLPRPREIMATGIGVQPQWQAMAAKYLRQKPETSMRRLPRASERLSRSRSLHHPALRSDASHGGLQAINAVSCPEAAASRVTDVGAACIDVRHAAWYAPRNPSIARRSCATRSPS
jgi:hypothetical protein